MAVNFTYNGEFEGNILIVGQTWCRKTTFIQKLAKNKLFGKLNVIFWIFKIPRSGEREKNISSCFQQRVNLKYSQTTDEFNMHLTYFQRKRYVNNDNDIVIGESNIFDNLIVMGDVSGLAEKSDNFANFFNWDKKLNCTCVYVFHTMHPTRSFW